MGGRFWTWGCMCLWSLVCLAVGCLVDREGLKTWSQRKAKRRRKMERALVRADRRHQVLVKLASDLIATRKQIEGHPRGVSFRYEPRPHPTHGWLATKHQVVVRTPTVSKTFRIELPGDHTEDMFEVELDFVLDSAKTWLRGLGVEAAAANPEEPPTNI